MDKVDQRLKAILAENWWMLLLRGLLAIVFGALTWALPIASLASLVLLFGAFALADGLVGAWTAVAERKEHDDWWVLLLWALVSIGAGVLTFMAPALTGLVLLFYIAAWAVAGGVLQIVLAIRLRKQISGEWMMALAGLASVVFGVLLMIQPDAGAVAVVWLIGSYALFFGVLLVVLSFKVRSLAKRA